VWDAGQACDSPKELSSGQHSETSGGAYPRRSRCTKSSHSGPRWCHRFRFPYHGGYMDAECDQTCHNVIAAPARPTLVDFRSIRSVPVVMCMGLCGCQRPRTSGGVVSSREGDSPIDLSMSSTISDALPRKKTPLKGRRSRPNLTQADAGFPSDDEISAALATTTMWCDCSVSWW
jgi:hypothetical protein